RDWSSDVCSSDLSNFVLGQKCTLWPANLANMIRQSLSSLLLPNILMRIFFDVFVQFMILCKTSMEREPAISATPCESAVMTGENLLASWPFDTSDDGGT